MYALFGNRGQYRMPYTPEFQSVEEARAYFRQWWPGGNRYIVVLPTEPRQAESEEP